MNIENLNKKLKAMAAKAQADNATGVEVGYTAAYALYVHENLEAKHPVGQAKFLEGPARRQAKKILDIVKQGLKRKLPLPQALFLAGLFLQRESQKLCPVLTGALKGSAFTRYTR